jgi:hypothetical protein
MRSDGNIVPVTVWMLSLGVTCLTGGDLTRWMHGMVMNLNRNLDQSDSTKGERMCIIAVKPKGVAMPPKKHLENCFDNNNDGAGMMFWDDARGVVVIDKGYMSWKPFWKSVCRHNFSKNDTVIFHFRLATAGMTCGANTHPFPLSQDTDDLKLIYTECDIAMVHNGIFGRGEDGMSDTMVWVRDIFSEPCVKDNMTNLIMQLLLEEYCHGSKLAFLKDDGEIILFGTFQENKGVKYSNDDYKKHWWTKYTQKHQKTNPQWYKKREDQAAPCNTCCESTCEGCDYWSHLQSANKDDHDYAPSCPLCREFDDIVSDYHGVFECMSCGCVYDDKREVIAHTTPANQRYTRRHHQDETPCHTCEVRTTQECVDCEKWQS